MASVPPLLKSIAPFLQRADEFDKHDPTVAYFCRYYAAQVGIKDPQAVKDKTSKAFLIGLMDRLEADKKRLPNEEVAKNDSLAQAHLESFAFKLFDHADNEDRAGRANKNVVKAFYAASLLFEVLKLFGDLDAEIVEKQKYAKYKTVYITKCIKSGETPIPGPPGGDTSSSNVADSLQDAESSGAGVSGGFQRRTSSFSSSTTPADSFSYPAAAPRTSLTATTSTMTAQIASMPAPPPLSYPSAAMPSSFSTNSTSSSTVGLEDISKAQKCAKYALSALQYEDIATAVKNLEEALQLLKAGKR